MAAFAEARQPKDEESRKGVILSRTRYTGQKSEMTMDIFMTCP